MEYQVGRKVHYINNNNRIRVGKITSKINPRTYQMDNCNHLVNVERIFKNQEDAVKYFQMTKGWKNPE